MSEFDCKFISLKFLSEDYNTLIIEDKMKIQNQNENVIIEIVRTCKFYFITMENQHQSLLFHAHTNKTIKFK